MGIWGIFFCILNLPSYFGVALYSQQYIGGFLALSLTGTFLKLPARSGGKPKWYDLVLAVLSLPAGLYIAINYPAMATNLARPTMTTIIIGSLAILLLIEAIRRTMGLSLCIIVVAFLLYARFSSLIPGLFRGRALSTPNVVNYIYTDSNSLLWMLATATTVGVAFIFFGQVLLNYGGGKSFVDVALTLCGRTRGAGAKAAVVGSGLVGMITGAPVANVLLCGSVTIPMMKSMGYPPHKAAAVESVSSTGGQIMPPVMGIAAFIIADTLGVPYSHVALAALFPALLFYIILFVILDLDAGKMGMKGLPTDQIPGKRATLKRAWVLLPGLVFLIAGMFNFGLPPEFCAVVAGFISLPFLAYIKENRAGFFKKVIQTVIDTGDLSINIGILLSAAGLVVGAINASGVAFNITLALTSLAGGHVLPLLIMAAIVSLILGMGMPSVAAYALVAVLVVPGLTAAGINPMAAHLFVFFWAVTSNITPPVAVACYAAAPLAGSTLWPTGLEACRVAISIYITPFLFLYMPALVMAGTASEIAVAFLTSLIGMAVFALGYVGYFRKTIPWSRRAVFLLAGAVIMFPNLFLWLKGIALIVFIFMFLPDVRGEKQAAPAAD